MENQRAGCPEEPPSQTYFGLGSLAQRIPAIARVERTTLIFGPTGAGKEVVARSLHRHSARRVNPFVAIHCAALPDSLVEAELFGHSRGAFTGAVQSRPGLIRSADHGTLFLDEIDSMSLATQAKLLRFVDSGEYRSVGSDRLEHSDAWILAATNQNLRARVRAGAFREDLLYRLEVVRIDVPALSERRCDVMVLAEHFIGQLGGPAKRLSARARTALEGHDWPGNVRELKHRVESAALLTEGEVIEVEALGFAAGASAAAPDARGPHGAGLSAPRGSSPDANPQELATAALEQGLWRLVQERHLTLSEATATCERMLVDAALRSENNNRTRAAGRLGINVRTIYKKMSG
jgi:DNA-binding NtrC family response regulator